MVKSRPNEPISAWKLPCGEKQAQQLLLDPVPREINEACQRLPGGAYTTLRTYQGNRVLRLEQHFQRLEQSAAIVGIPVGIDRHTAHKTLRMVITETIAQNAQAAGTETAVTIAVDHRLRLVLDLEKIPGDLYIVCGMLITPAPDDYLNGVKVIISDLRRGLPEAKLTGFLEEAGRQPLPPDANEALMVNEDGRILEGLSSNFYAALNGVIWTAAEDVLPGTTRSLLLDEVLRLGIPLHLEAPRLADIPLMSDAFLTSTSRGILPVTRIDEHVVGSGKPGAIIRQLGEAFWSRLESELENI
jgi:branched-chain amino acid aminotransferase